MTPCRKWLNWGGGAEPQVSVAYVSHKIFRGGRGTVFVRAELEQEGKHETSDVFEIRTRKQRRLQ